VSFWWLVLGVTKPSHRARSLKVLKSFQSEQAEGFSEISRRATPTLRNKAPQEFLKKSCKHLPAWLSVKYNPKYPQKNRNDNQFNPTDTSRGTGGINSCAG